MIVTPLEQCCLLVTQADHARFAADLLALFPVDELRRHPRRTLLLRAVAEHDNGWWEPDAAPALGPSGRPVDFRQVGDPQRREIWRRGADRYAATEPGLAALVATHALRLASARSDQDENWRQFRLELEAFRDELAGLAGLSSTEIAELDRWMSLADSLALAAASGDASFVDWVGLRAAAIADDQGTTLHLAPFPLAGATRIELSCRRLTPEPLVSIAELSRALVTARWERRPVRVAPLETQ